MVELMVVVVGEYDVVDFCVVQVNGVFDVLYIFDDDFVGLDVVDDGEIVVVDGWVYCCVQQFFYGVVGCVERSEFQFWGGEEVVLLLWMWDCVDDCVQSQLWWDVEVVVFVVQVGVGDGGVDCELQCVEFGGCSVVCEFV